MARNKNRSKKKNQQEDTEPKVPIDRGTSETRKKLVRVTPIQWLIERQRISLEEQRAADEIAQVFHAAAHRVMFKRPSMQKIDGGRDDDRLPVIPDHIRNAYDERYMPWVDTLTRLHKRGEKPALAVCIDMIVDERSARDIDTARGWRKGTAVEVVTRALTMYVEMAGWRRAAA